MKLPIVFVGPSLPVREVKQLLRCETRPPARQGDVWRALKARPTALVLLDGVFESTPSVWHHELLAALRCGIPVLGGSSMGALRAAELEAHGMTGAGQIFRWYRDGVLDDDAEVALLHASAEHGHRPLTVPLVNVRRLASLLKLKPAAARDFIQRAGAIHYQRRHRKAVLALLSPAHAAQAAQLDFDLKASDARETLRLTHELLEAGSIAPPPRAATGSSLVRRRRLLDTEPELLASLARSKDRSALEREGVTLLLLAQLAREWGLAPEPERVEAALKRLKLKGVAEDERVALAEAQVLADTVLEHAERLVADGPSGLEGLVAAARMRR